MQFASRMHQGTYEMVASWLADLLKKEAAIAIRDQPVFLVPAGSAVAQVVITPGGDDKEAYIDAKCAVCQLERADETLFKFLADQNLSTKFGWLAWHDKTKVVYARTSLFGSTCAPDQFWAALTELVKMSDALDDQLVKAFGGKTGRDYFNTMMSDDKPSG